MERRKLYGAQRIKLPEADDKKERKKVMSAKTEYQLRLRFVIYAHFKSVLRKQDSCGPSLSKSFITQYQHGVPCGSCIYMKCNDGQYFEPPQINMGDDAAEKFLEQAFTAATICRQHLANNVPMKRLTQEQWREYFTGIKFRGFRVFWPNMHISAKFNPAKNRYRRNPRN